MKKNIKSAANLEENFLEIYLDFQKDLTIIAHHINKSVIYSIQNDDVLQSNIKTKDFFRDLITKGNWKKIIDF
jgi:hypothetical protein